MGPSGKPEAFHLYSMRQAIEEGFILDVLTNYTSYKTYYRLVKEAEDDPDAPEEEGRACAGESSCRCIRTISSRRQR